MRSSWALAPAESSWRIFASRTATGWSENRYSEIPASSSLDSAIGTPPRLPALAQQAHQPRALGVASESRPELAVAVASAPSPAVRRRSPVAVHGEGTSAAGRQAVDDRGPQRLALAGLQRAEPRLGVEPERRAPPIAEQRDVADRVPVVAGDDPQHEQRREPDQHHDGDHRQLHPLAGRVDEVVADRDPRPRPGSPASIAR